MGDESRSGQLVAKREKGKGKSGQSQCSVGSWEFGVFQV